MAIGACQWMTCGSVLGSPFRARFRLGAAEDRYGDREVLLCPTHTREGESLRARVIGSLVITEEGVVYPIMVIDALNFLT